MPTIKVPSIKSTINNSGITSSNVSSSISSNMDLIQSQISEKTNEYINVKNAVKILEKYSNWNGYIKLYTEVESNFNTGDTIYITYTEPTIDTTRVFNLDNSYNNFTHSYYDNPFDDNISKFAFGYKILYVNKYKNELVINRYYNDITPGFVLSNQCLSKVSIFNGTLFNDVADGVVFFGGQNLSCNIFSGEFSIIQGIVCGVTYSTPTYYLLTGATVICTFMHDNTDNNGFYSLNVPIGTQTIKYAAPGFITKTLTTSIITNKINKLDVTLTGGTNSISIYADNPFYQVCAGGVITFYAETVGYDPPVTYQWKILRNSNWILVGTDNSVFAYNAFQNNDIVKCEVRDDLDIINNTYTESNGRTISITPVTITVSPGTTIICGTSVTFTVTIPCSTSPIYKWRLNEYDVASTPTYTSTTLVDGDQIYCEVNGNKSNTFTMSVSCPPTTTTTTTTPMPSTTLPPLGTYFEVFGQLYNF